MKKNINKIIQLSFLFLGIIVSLSSCTDYLDKAPLSEIDPNDAYKNFQNFQGFTEELYNCIPLVTANASHNSWDWGDDVHWIPNDTRSFCYRVDQGDYWQWNSGGDHYGWLRAGGNPASDNTGDKGRLWGLAWYGIRKANIGLANLEKLTEATQEERDLIEGQLYFFRAWFHFMLMQFWGGLPYIDEALPSDEVFRLPRLTYQETADKASEDFKKAAELLPLDWNDTAAGKRTLGNNNIRINRIMALAYLGKNELWAGSPLMNKGVNADGLTDYDSEYCKRAADAFAEVLDLCDRTNRYELAKFEEYTGLFYTFKQNGKLPGLKEAIFFENLVNASGSRYRWNQVNDYVPKTLINSGVKHYPAANYVDFYGTKTGYPIDDPESGWSKEYPWKDRDPRFYTDIRYDGVKMALNTAGNLAEDRQYASLYTGGLYRTSNGMEGILSGYMMSKFMHPMTNEWDGTRDQIIAVLSFMRLADVYLMYAESTLMGYGSHTSKGKVKGADYRLSALDAVNVIRTRAGVGNVAEKFHNQTGFLNEIRRERAVELAFEGHRFTDLRRWLLLDKHPYNVKTLVDFDRANDVPNAELYENPENGRVLNWSYGILKERNLGQKHYWLPFLKKDVEMYKEFKQNPGW